MYFGKRVRLILVSLTVILYYVLYAETYENSVSSITCLCLDIIGAYIEWTDIG